MFDIPQSGYNTKVSLLERTLVITSTLSGTTLSWIQQQPTFAEISDGVRTKILSAPVVPYRRGSRATLNLELPEAEELVTWLDDLAAYGENQRNLPLNIFSKYQAVRNDSLRLAELFS